MKARSIENKKGGKKKEEERIKYRKTLSVEWFYKRNKKTHGSSLLMDDRRNIHELSRQLTRFWLIYSLNLKQFCPTSPTKYCFCAKVVSRLRKVYDEGGESWKTYIFARKMESLGTSLSSPWSRPLVNIL